MLEKRTTIDRIEVLPESMSIQIRQKIAIVEIEDSVETEISHSFNRYVLTKGDALDEQPDEVKAIATAAWGIE